MRPLLLTDRKINPSVMSAAASQSSMARFVQLGIGTLRTHSPLPIRSTITQRASRSLNLVGGELGGFAAAETAA
jgi:hypothetical protein